LHETKTLPFMASRDQRRRERGHAPVSPDSRFRPAAARLLPPSAKTSRIRAMFAAPRANRYLQPVERASRRIAAALASGTAAAAAPTPALAQTPSELAQARARFDEGLSLAAAGDWASALTAFQDVARVKLTPQVRFHIARCEEKLGFWVRA